MALGKAAQRDIVQFVPFRKFKHVRLVVKLNNFNLLSKVGMQLVLDKINLFSIYLLSLFV